MRLSVAVMAHPARRDLVDELLPRLGVGGDRVVWDRRGDEWDTAARAWEAHDPAADWHLVIQDDAVVCQDLTAGLEKALDHVPAASVVSLYLGTMRPMRHHVDRLVGDADLLDASWVQMATLVWGVAIAAPTGTIGDMLAWCETNHHPNYDTRLGRFYAEQLRWPAYYTWPCLVDHAQVPSLVGHRGARRARRFIGETASALSACWSRDTVGYDWRNTTMTAEDLLVATQSFVCVGPDGRRYTVRKGVTRVRAGHPILVGRQHLFEAVAPSRGYDVEQATAAPGERRQLSTPPPAEEYPRHVGGGTWELSDGSRVRGREDADGIGALVVSTDGRDVEGIVTERDLVRVLARQGAAALDGEVRSIMTATVVTCARDATADEVMSMMTDSRFRHVPVVEDGALVGIISIGDVVKSTIDELEVKAKSLESYVTGTY